MTSTKKHRRIATKPRALPEPEAIVAWIDKIEHGNYQETIEKLYRKGCKRLPLMFLMLYSGTDCFWAELKEKLNRRKKELGAVIRRVESVANVLTNLADDDFLRSKARDLSSIAVAVARHKKRIAADQSIRNTGVLRSVGPLWFYCKAATRGKITLREVADLINATLEVETDNETVVGEHDVSMRLNRFKKRDATNYYILKTMMQQYVTESPAGDEHWATWAKREQFLENPFGIDQALRDTTNTFGNLYQPAERRLTR